MNTSLAIRGTLVLVVDALGPAFKGQPSYNILLAYTSMRLCLETDTLFESICLSQVVNFTRFFSERRFTKPPTRTAAREISSASRPCRHSRLLVGTSYSFESTDGVAAVQYFRMTATYSQELANFSFGGTPNSHTTSLVQSYTYPLAQRCD